MKDPIVEEVRAARAEIAAECGYELRRILDHARATARKIPGLRYVSKQDLAARRLHKRPDFTVPNDSRR